MQFCNVLEKECYRYRAAAAMIFSKTYRCRDNLFQNLPRPRRSGGGSGSAAMDISDIREHGISTHCEMKIRVRVIRFCNKKNDFSGRNSCNADIIQI
jgi:hypothetical protein